MPPAYAHNPLYTDEFKASVKRAYTETNEPMWSIATRHGFAARTLEKMVARERWPKRREQVRTLIPAQHLLEEAQAMLAANQIGTSWPGRAAPRAESERTGGTSPGHPRLERSEPKGVDARDEPGHDDKSLAAPSALDRIERLIFRELEIEEARREKLGEIPRPTAEAAKTARTLAVLTQTLDAVQRLRRREEAPSSGQRPENRIKNNDDPPEDIDEFRIALARRIDAFVASRADAGGSRPVVDETR